MYDAAVPFNLSSFSGYHRRRSTCSNSCEFLPLKSSSVPYLFLKEAHELWLSSAYSFFFFTWIQMTKEVQSLSSFQLSVCVGEIKKSPNFYSVYSCKSIMLLARATKGINIHTMRVKRHNNLDQMCSQREYYCAYVPARELILMAWIHGGGAYPSCKNPHKTMMTIIIII